jgi:hypothetical protein
MEERSGPDSGVVRAVPFGEPRRGAARSTGARAGGDPRRRKRRPAGIDELLSDLAALDQPPARRTRGKAAHPVFGGDDALGADVVDLGVDLSGAGIGFVDGAGTMDVDLDDLDPHVAMGEHPGRAYRSDGEGAGFGAAGPSRRSKRRRRAQPEPTVEDQRLDPGERAFLLQIYRELIGGVQGPVIPFPVELVVGEDEAPELERPADVIDLAWYRTRRALRDS